MASLGLRLMARWARKVQIPSSMPRSSHHLYETMLPNQTWANSCKLQRENLSLFAKVASHYSQM